MGSWTQSRYFYHQMEDFIWEELFAWLPRQLASTGEWVWFKKVYLGWRIVYGPGSDVVIRKYLTPEEYTWEMLVQHA